MYFAGIFLALSCLVCADIEPFFASEAYDHGDYGTWPQQSYHSSSLIGPVLNYLQHSERCDDDGKYTMITPRGASIASPGPMIIDHNGSLVWTKHYGPTYDLKVQEYQGEKYLTFWVGDDAVVGHGSGSYYMLNSFYEENFHISGARGRSADLHEFRITRENTALITVYDIFPANLSQVNGPEDGYIWDSGFQEIDIETGDALFEWWASDHFEFHDAYRLLEDEEEGRDKGRPWDFFHINSVDKDLNGNYMISSRYMSCISYIDGRNGRVIWKLGGKTNRFKDLSDGAATNISWQHHAQFRGGYATSITLFDNASRGPSAPVHLTRGLYLDLDIDNMTARIRHAYWSPRGLSSRSQGSLQILDNGNVLMGYGIYPAWTEYTLDGEVLCDVEFGPLSGYGSKDIISYRTSRHSWTGRPKTSPNISITDHNVYVSWNGATEVATWVLDWAQSIDATEDNYHSIVTEPKAGFETVLTVPENYSQGFIRVHGLDRSGYILGSTRIYGLSDDGVTILEKSLSSWVVISFVSALLCFSLVAICGIILSRRLTDETNPDYQIVDH